MQQTEEPRAVGGASSSSAQHGACRTARLLAQWPAVAAAAGRARDAYRRVKRGCRLLGWALGAAESAAFRSLAVLRPAVRLADRALSRGVEAFQARFPVVKRPPQEVTQSFTENISTLKKSLINEASSITEIGKNKINKFAMWLVEMECVLLRIVDKQMRRLHKYLAEPVPRDGAPSSSSATSESSSSPLDVQLPPLGAPQVGAFSIVVRALSAATAFYVGAAFWLASRAPLAGRLVDVDVSAGRAANTASSSSTSLSSSSSSSTSSLVTVVPVMRPREPVCPTH